MGYRDSIVPNVNYFYLHKAGAGKGVSRTRRGAELIRGVRAFRELLVRCVASCSEYRWGYGTED